MPTRFLRFVTFVHFPSSVRSFDLFCRFTCVHEGHFMLCSEEEFRIELSRKIVLWQIFIGHRSEWFPLLSACRLVEFALLVNLQKPFLPWKRDLITFRCSGRRSGTSNGDLTASKAAPFCTRGSLPVIVNIV